MKKARKVFVHILTCALLLTSCGRQSTWQEQYDLGIRYLSEGNYEEAIIAFTAAIEIDGSKAEIYDQLSCAYQELGEFDKAIAILEEGYEATGNGMLLESLEFLRSHFLEDTYKRPYLTQQVVYLSDGTMLAQTTVTYDQGGYISEKTEKTIKPDHNSYITHISTWVYDSERSTWVCWNDIAELDGEPVPDDYPYQREKGLDNCALDYESVVANVLGWPGKEGGSPERVYRSEVYDPNESEWYYAEYEYDDDGNPTLISSYREDGSLIGWCENTYDSSQP